MIDNYIINTNYRPLPLFTMIHTRNYSLKDVNRIVEHPARERDVAEAGELVARDLSSGLVEVQASFHRVHPFSSQVRRKRAVAVYRRNGKSSGQQTS